MQDEHNFSFIYAKLCKYLISEGIHHSIELTGSIEQKGEIRQDKVFFYFPTPFLSFIHGRTAHSLFYSQGNAKGDLLKELRKVLLNRCQEEFEKDNRRDAAEVHPGLLLVVCCCLSLRPFSHTHIYIYIISYTLLLLIARAHTHPLPLPLLSIILPLLPIFFFIFQLLFLILIHFSLFYCRRKPMKQLQPRAPK